MKTIALISGGKDSILSIILSMRYGHYPVVVANIAPECDDGRETVHEVDSYSFQTVGHEVVEEIAACMQLPFRRGYIRADQAKVQDLHYTSKRDEGDEIEALYRLLRSVKEEFPEVEAVTSGAILSNYQRHRVEDVCSRLKLRSLAFLWQRPAEEILDIATILRVEAILVKTATVGLVPQKHLGMSLFAARPELESIQRLYGAHAAGEGGEFETIVLDCPLFREKRLEVVELRPVIVDNNDYSPSGHAVLKVAQRAKTDEEKVADKHILQQLSLFTFPSDRMKHLPSLDQLIFEDLQMNENKAAFQTRKSEGDVVYWACTCGVYDACITSDRGAQQRILEDVLRKAIEDASKITHEVFFVLVLSPDVDLFDCFCAAFSIAFPDVCPPGCSFAEMNSLSAFRLEVLTAPQCSIDRSTMVVRSTSCWGAPSLGPYSFSNMLTVANECRTIVSGCVGLVSTTHQLATVADMGDLNVTSISEVYHSIGIPDEGTVKEFIAQFAFMYANSVNGLTYFRIQPNEVTHVTFLLTDMRFAPLLGPLWRWCSAKHGGGRELIFYRVTNLSGVPGKYVVCRVLPVVRLLCGAAVEAIFERRITADEREGT